MKMYNVYFDIKIISDLQAHTQRAQERHLRSIIYEYQ